jgi:hypothetical protein
MPPTNLAILRTICELTIPGIGSGKNLVVSIGGTRHHTQGEEMIGFGKNFVCVGGTRHHSQEKRWKPIRTLLLPGIIILRTNVGPFLGLVLERNSKGEEMEANPNTFIDDENQLYFSENQFCFSQNVPSVMMFGIGSNVQCKSSQVLVRRS